MSTFCKIISIALLAAVVSATTFCKCENPDHDRVFPGINEPCSKLSDDWCSTNCNLDVLGGIGNVLGALGGFPFGARSVNSLSGCDYCQFKPRGTGPDNDYQALLTWCKKQSGYDGTNAYYGTEVNCFSYHNRVHKGALQSGCTHEDNGEDLSSAQNDPGAAFRLPGFFKVSFFYLVPNGPGTSRRQSHLIECEDIYYVAAQKLSIDFLQDHPDCEIRYDRPESEQILLECPEDDAAFASIRSTFNQECKDSLGGKDGRPGRPEGF